MQPNCSMVLSEDYLRGIQQRNLNKSFSKDLPSTAFHTKTTNCINYMRKSDRFLSFRPTTVIAIIS